MGLFSRKPGSLLGVDIGATAVALVELSHAHESCRLDAWAVEALPDAATAAENISDAGAVGATIRRTAKRAGCRARRAAFAVPGSVAVTKTIDIDASLSDRELEVEVVLEADRHLPFRGDEIALDFEQLHLSATDPSRAEVLLVACRAEHVEHRRAAVESAGLTAVAADIETFCLQRAVRNCVPRDCSAVAVAEIGAAATTLCVSDRDAVIFTRTASFDGARLHAGADGSRRAAEDWLRVVARLLRLYAATPSGTAIPRLLLAGGGATAPGLAPLATQELGLPTMLVDPFAGMAVAGSVDAAALGRQAPRLATACGLALRDFDADADAAPVGRRGTLDDGGTPPEPATGRGLSAWRAWRRG